MKTVPKPPAPTTYDSLVEFTAAGHREVAPVFLKDDRNGLLGVHGAHGLYRMGLHADGRPVVLFTADPHSLDPVQHRDEKFRNKYAPGYYLNSSAMNNIEVVAARSARQQKKWVMEAINRHSYHYNEMRTEYGFLHRVSDRIWASSSVVYALDRLDPRHPDFDPEKNQFMLSCYTAGARGLSIVDMVAKLQDGKPHPLLKFCARKCVVDADEASAIVRDDFVKRTALVLRDRDPGLLGRVKDEPELSSRLSPNADKMSEKAKQSAGHVAGRTIQAVERQVRTIRARYVAMGFAKTLALSAIQLLFKGWRASVGQLVMGIFQPVLDAIKSAEKIGNRTEDVAQSFWQPGRSAQTGNEHYCRLDTEQGHLIRLLGYDESNVRPVQGATLQARLPDDWAEESILDTLGSPPGSVMERRRVGNMDVLYVEQPDGMAVHYLIGKKMAYAELRPSLLNPLADPMPEPIRRLFAEKGSLLKVAEGKDGRLRCRALTPEKLRADMALHTAEAPLAGLKPRVDFDLNLLDEFARRANPPAAEPGKVQKIIATGFNVAGRAARMVGLPVKPPEQDNEPSRMQKILDHHLKNRGPL